MKDNENTQDVDGSGSSDCYVAYCVDLHRKNTDALGFIPQPKLERYAERGQVMIEFENEEPCGFLVHGSKSTTMKIYQACIQFDARRWKHGVNLVERLKAKAIRNGCHAIRLRCGADLQSNQFWLACGFELTGTHQGGKRRGRMINEYRLALDVPVLFAS